MPRILIILLITGLFVLHQDLWLWRTVTPLTFGFLPAGLAYHAGFTVAASVLMWLLVRFSWPGELEADAEASRRDREI